MLETLRSAYALIEQFSVTGLVVAAVVLTLAFLFAMREAASWFFKIDDIKRDVRKLHGVIVELEAEIRSLQSMARGSSPILQAIPDAPETSELKKPEAKTSGAGFPIIH